MKRQGFQMTKQQISDHQKHHGFNDPFPAETAEAIKKAWPTRRKLNKTESEFGLFLMAARTKGEILRYVYQGITLRYANGELRYTPDWFVVIPDAERWAKCIEVKGSHTPPTFWQHARQRFLACKADWPEFDFEMWRKEKGLWTKIL